MENQIKITENQQKALKAIIAGKVSITEVDGRAVNALEKRGLVKKTESKKGIFVIATAKGKKFLN